MTKEQDEEARWKWVLSELFKSTPHVQGVRYEEPITDDELSEHIVWLTHYGPTCGELDGEPAKAARWACWCQGAMVALGWVTLAECKELNRRVTWESVRAAQDEAAE